jgi:serine O-acetyltransferase
LKILNNMQNFVSFLLKRIYNAQPIDGFYCEEAFRLTCLDVQYHFPNVSEEEVKNRIVQNQNELAIFLFRLGNLLHIERVEILKWQVHWLLKELCSCEIYFNNKIDTGFYVIHGEGTVIGSRNKIGKGFKIHQGCTIGHKKNGGGIGNTIGDDVTLYANSSIMGELKIGNRVVIGSHVIVFKDIDDDALITVNSQNKGYNEKNTVFNRHSSRFWKN